MNKFQKFSVTVIIMQIVLIFGVNFLYAKRNNTGEGRMYLVEAKHLVEEIVSKQMDPEKIENMSLEKYPSLISISEFDPMESTDYDYVVKQMNGRLYRISYKRSENKRLPGYINVVLVGMCILTLIVLGFVNKKVLKPFSSMTNLPLELAKGNLSKPVKEEKSRLFGRFLWGMDMLREKLEDSKEKELELQKERKMLILSLSHDIKTPLSSIELYTKALLEDLYETKEKKTQALQGINKNVKEIKTYVNEIVTASREDFLNLEVKTGEYYLDDVMNDINAYYRDKLSLTHTEFIMDKIPQCLLFGDRDRVVEVLQNVMENAIKYGDGKTITITFDEEEEYKFIQIENTGCTLKDEEIPNIFDSFYRGSNAENKKGSGLGLYICKNLMKKMNGDIFANKNNNLFCVTVVAKKA